MARFGRLVCRRLASARPSTICLPRQFSSQVGLRQHDDRSTSRGPKASHKEVDSEDIDFDELDAEYVPPIKSVYPKTSREASIHSLNVDRLKFMLPSNDADEKGILHHLYDADFETKLRFYNITNVDRVREMQTSSATGEPYGELTVLLTGGMSAISLAVANELLSGGVRHLILGTSSAKEGIAAIQSLLGRWKRKTLPISYYCYNDKTGEHLFLDDLDHNVLINCSDVSGTLPFLLETLQSVKEQWQTNYHLPLHLIRAMMRAYQKKARLLNAEKSRTGSSLQPKTRPTKSWCVVNVSSILASHGGAGSAQYAASKAALNAFTRVMTVECRNLWARYDKVLPPIRMNAVLPGYMNTRELATQYSRTKRDKMKDRVPLQRLGECHEVAHAVGFLLQNEYANNCVLNLDGGLSAI